MIEPSWHSRNLARSDLGLDGEPFFLLTETSRNDGKRLQLDFAIEAECTHLGCLAQDVTLLARPGGFTCPCDGSKYGVPDSSWQGRSPSAQLTALGAVRPQLYASAPRRRSRPPVAAMASERVVLEVDLGKAGEPAGRQRLTFQPKLARSDFILLDLKVPLGMLIEETEGGDIVVEGALPGYSSAGGDGEPDLVQPGDLIRAVTAYRKVLAGAPMWQQLASYTPVGKLEMKRLIFRTEGATFADVRDAIASHRVEEGGNGVVTLVLERSVDASTPLNTTRDSTPPRVEPLADVIKRDLQRKRVEDDLTKQVEGMSAAERTQRLLDLGFDVREEE